MKKVIITGASGMVGRGVLLECLESNDVEKVLVINRNAIGITHPKLQEVLLKDFQQIGTLKEKLHGYDACFYCMGVSAVGLDEPKYTAITYDTAKAFADVLFDINPNITFNYVSGQGTDSSEKGSAMWARVKGKTENMIFNRGFRDAYAFRPGAIIPEKGVKSRTPLYNAIYVVMRPFFPLFKLSSSTTTTTRLGKAMINSLFVTSTEKILTPQRINQLAASR